MQKEQITGNNLAIWQVKELVEQFDVVLGYINDDLKSLFLRKQSNIQF